MTTAALAAPALASRAAQSRARAGDLRAQMWAYLAAYELPHDDAERQAQRVRLDYPIDADRVLGFGTPPTVRLQRGLSTPGQINRFERLLVWCHWVWFTVPHGERPVRPGQAAQALPRGGSADVRGVRPRRDLLLGDPDRAALVGRPQAG